MLLLKGEEGETYNVAFDLSNISLRELAEKLSFLGGVNIKDHWPENYLRGKIHECGSHYCGRYRKQDRQSNSKTIYSCDG